MIETVLVSLWLSICAYWIFVHVKFYTALKRHEPELYKENSRVSPTKSATGFGYVDFALSGGHKKSENKNVIKSGERLVHAYEVRPKVLGYGFFFMAIWFGVSMFLWGNE